MRQSVAMLPPLRGSESHPGCRCKVLKRLQLSGCWRDSSWSTLSVTDRLSLQSRLQFGTRSPWHSGANLPPQRFDGASRGLGFDGWGVLGVVDHWRPADSVLSIEEAERLRPALWVEQRVEGGTPGSDHVGKLGKARRMPNTSAWTVCRCPASGDDLTLARRIGRIWTRPFVRGNIALLGREEQTYRAFAFVDLCECRRRGRSRAHTFRGRRPQRGATAGFNRRVRGLRRTSLGAR